MSAKAKCPERTGGRGHIFEPDLTGCVFCGEEESKVVLRRVIIARERDMGEFVSDFTCDNKEAEKLVMQLRKIFEDCGINLGAYSRLA